MSWVAAVKEFAKQNGGNYLIPKRDTPEYEKVKAIQAKLALKEPEPVAKAPVKKVKAEPESAGIATAPKKPKVKRVEPKEVEPLPEPEEVKIKTAPQKKKILKVVEAKPSPVKTKKDLKKEEEEVVEKSSEEKAVKRGKKALEETRAKLKISHDPVVVKFD